MQHHPWVCGPLVDPCMQVHILLRQGASPTDCLKAAFSAHVFLHMLDEEHKQQSQKQPASSSSSSSTSSLGSSLLAAGSGIISSSASSGSSAGDAASSSGGSRSSSTQHGRWPWSSRGKAKPDAAAEAAAAAAAQPLTGADLVRETWNKLAIALPWGQDPGSGYYRQLLERSKCAVDSLYSDFSRQAAKQGWQLPNTMLNPKESRVLRLTPLSA